ncbi:efflux RND transporter permease subunit [Halosquirtibacter xylanolyticus]|uniref:efflux RND transporter permease subunit n=1 Tax=Halosquirtibacter xylanolyticus TaxID=3374599 RepID=UPI003749EC58|nr:efflux RND transporter permease subunit [Prolixibacteraceae bacterium]
MKKILSLFVKYPFYGKVIIMSLLLLGGISMSLMKKASFPLIESHTITVSVTYQGATPKEMDEGVTSVIEDALRGTVGMKEFSSVSRENSAVVTVIVENDYNVDEVLTDVKNTVDGISNFPANAEKPVVAKQKTKTIALFMKLSSKENDLMKLKERAQKVEDDLRASGLVSQITIYGYPSRMEMSVEVDESMLRRYQMTFQDVQNAISNNNVDMYAGLIKNHREEIKINARERSTRIDDIENIVVRSNINGDLVRIKDVAEVHYQFEDIPRKSFVDGDRSAFFVIEKLRTEDLQKISDYILNYCDEYNEANKDMNIKIVRDFRDSLDAQLGILYSNGLMGMILVVIALSVFLSFRLSLWVAWGIPSSFLGMFIVANMLGVTINFISVFGMILIVGILVDDGIVIGENIFTHFEMGKSPRRAAIDGTLEVIPAVLTSVSTTIIAFCPLFFIQGSLEMMYEMAAIVVLCLIFSLFEGMFVLPGHLASETVLKPLKKDSWYGKVRNFFDKLIFGLRDRLYLPLLQLLLKYKAISISVFTAIIIITVGLLTSGRIATTIFPAVSEDNFVIDLCLKPGVNEGVTLERLRMISTKVEEVNQELANDYKEELPIESIALNTGWAFNGTESGSNTGNMRVFLRKLDDSKMSSHMIKLAISKKVGKIKDAYKFTVGASNRFGAPVSISLMGSDKDELENATEDFKSELAKFSSLYNIMDNNQIGTQEVIVKLKPAAYALGLNEVSLMNQVRKSFYGGLSQRIQKGRDEIWFYVRYPIENRRTVGQLEKMMINTSKGMYPLVELADLSIQRGLTSINHFNGKVEIRVDAYMVDESESVPPVLEKIENEVLPKIMAAHQGVTYMHQGQVKDTTDEASNIVISFGVAFFLILIILIIFFRSFTQGMMIVAMIPFGIIAALWGHFIEGIAFSSMSLWGMVALSGTIINDAVVLLDRYNQNLKRGFHMTPSIIEAAKSRFRPIMLTTITTTAGLFPLIRETSSDTVFIKPMAISLAYGILIGTFFILTVLPVYVTVANKFRLVYAHLKGDTDATPESVETAVRDQKVSEALEVSMAKEIEDDRNENDFEL